MCRHERDHVVGILKDFERGLEGAVEGFFGRVFRSRLQPVELAKALQRYGDDHKLVSADGTVVQNVYEFTVGTKDHERLVELGDALPRELAEVVRRTAQERGHRLLGPVAVRLRRDDAVRVGMFELAGRVDATVPRAKAGGHLPAAVPAARGNGAMFAPAGGPPPGSAAGDVPPVPPAAETVGGPPAAAVPGQQQPAGTAPGPAGAHDQPPSGVQRPGPAGAHDQPPSGVEQPGLAGTHDQPPTPVARTGAGPADAAGAAAEVADRFAPQVDDPDALAVVADLEAPPAFARPTPPGLPDEPPPFSLEPPAGEAPLFGSPPPPAAPPDADAVAGPSGSDAQAPQPGWADGAAVAREAGTSAGMDGAVGEPSSTATPGRSGAPASGADVDAPPAGGPSATSRAAEPTTVDERPGFAALVGRRSRLTVTAASVGVGTSIALTGGRLVVGRHRDCDLRLDDPTVSREHATFVRRGATWWVLDMGSTNGTTVNGVGAGEQSLSDGDVVAVGDVELTFAEG